MIKRKTYSFRGGDILDIEEYHDGRYGAPGLKRMKRRKSHKRRYAPSEQMEQREKMQTKIAAVF